MYRVVDLNGKIAKISVAELRDKDQKLDCYRRISGRGYVSERKEIFFFLLRKEFFQNIS